MSAHFTPTSSVTTVDVLSQSQVVDVEAVSGVTVPSGVALTINVPLDAWRAGNQDAYLEPPAAIVEGWLSEGLVSSVVYVQAPGPSRLLAGFVDVTVTYTPPTPPELPFHETFRAPMTALRSRDAYTAWASTPPHVAPIVTAYNRLVDRAGGPESDKV